MGSCIEPSGQVAGAIVGAFSDPLRSNAEDHWVCLKRPDTILVSWWLAKEERSLPSTCWKDCDQEREFESRPASDTRNDRHGLFQSARVQAVQARPQPGSQLSKLECQSHLDTNIFNVGLFVIVLACPKVVRLIRSYLRFRTVV
jgi:hypothetical protein